MHPPNPHNGDESAPLAPLSPLPRRIERLINWMCRRAANPANARWDSERAEDLRQQAVLLLSELRERLDAMPPEAADAYRYESVRHLLLREITQERERGRRLLRGESAEKAMEAAFAPANTEMAGALLGGLVDPLDLRVAITALKPEDRRIIVWSYYEGWSDREIAEATGQLLDTVKSRRRRLLEHLRKMLDML